MQYRIELSSTAKGVARVHLPGRKLEIEAKGATDSGWQVEVSDPRVSRSGLIMLTAGNANEAIWRVARAVVRAVSELTGSPIEGGLRNDPDPLRVDLP